MRLAKCLLTSIAALFISLVVFNNVTDYGSNLAYVQHVLTMDTTFPDNRGLWRRIELPALHHAAYLLIILAEVTIGVTLWIGTLRLWKRRAEPAGFDGAKGPIILGLAGGVALFFGLFLALGGEWFLMWQSDKWNAQPESAMFATLFALLLIFMAQHDDEMA